MAKRKRLTPAQSGFLAGPGPATPARAAPLSAAPIAQVAGDAAAVAALGELSEAMDRAREEGRLILSLPLEAVEAGYLVRDRLVQNDEDMAALKASLRARGQQTPIEVVALPQARGALTHGLISGWRRLTALRELAAEEGGAAFATVQARLITPESQQSAYVAMVEENEIRADLSHFERARIARQAWKEGVYPTLKQSLNGLFGSVSRSRRSKINSFVPLVETLDPVLNYPAAISEKLGLALSQAIRDEAFCKTLVARLKRTALETAEAEIAFLNNALQGRSTAPSPGKVKQEEPAVKANIHTRFDTAKNRIELSGDGVDADLFAALQRWLKSRG